MLNRLERYLGKIAIHNFSVYLAILTLVASGYQLYIKQPPLGNLSLAGLARGEWWNLFLYPFVVQGGILYIGIFVYMIWAFGQMLESALGAFRFTIFIFLGLILMVLGTLFVVPVSNYYLELSIVIGVAYMMPNMEIRLWFILPIRMKWIGWLSLAYVIFSVVRAWSVVGWLAILPPLLGLGNILILFGWQMVTGVSRSTSSRIRKQKFQPSTAAIHRCTVCGLTEHDDARMDFRYCVDCEDHEYCANHLHDHEHIRG